MARSSLRGTGKFHASGRPRGTVERRNARRPGAWSPCGSSRCFDIFLFVHTLGHTDANCAQTAPVRVLVGRRGSLRGGRGLASGTHGFGRDRALARRAMPQLDRWQPAEPLHRVEPRASVAAASSHSHIRLLLLRLRRSPGPVGRRRHRRRTRPHVDHSGRWPRHSRPRSPPCPGAGRAARLCRCVTAREPPPPAPPHGAWALPGGVPSRGICPPGREQNACRGKGSVCASLHALVY